MIDEKQIVGAQRAAPLRKIGAFLSRHLPSATRHLLPVTHRLPVTRTALTILTLVAFFLRTPQLDAQSLWRDEMDVILIASQSWPQLIQSLTKEQHNGPLYYLLMRGWLGLVGDSEFALRYLSLCFGTLAIPLIYQLGWRLVGQKAAMMTAALAAISPYLVWYSQDAKMYALVTVLTLLATIWQLEALATGRLRWWTGFVVVVSLSLYIHLLSALMIPVYAAIFLLAWPRYRQRWQGWLASFGLLTLPYVPLLIWQLPLVLKTHETGHPFYPIQEMLALLFNLYSRGVGLVGSWPVLAAFVFAMLVGVFSAPGGNDQSHSVGGRRFDSKGTRSRLFLLLWLFLPVVLVYLISLRAPVFEPRYLIFVAPAFYLLTALGVVALSRLSHVATGLALAIMLSFSVLGVGVQATAPIKSNFRAAAACVTTHHRGGVPIMFQMPYSRHTFDYYFDGDYVPLDGLWTNDGKTEAQVNRVMMGLLADYADVWLVASESWLWDSRDLTRTWLDEHARLVESASFTLVDVYHYDLSNLKPTSQPVDESARQICKPVHVLIR